MHFLGFNVIPRRVPDFPDSFHSFHAKTDTRSPRLNRILKTFPLKDQESIHHLGLHLSGVSLIYSRYLSTKDQETAVR